MELVAAPVFLIPMAVLLGPDIALLRQIGQHGGEFLLALLLHAGAALPGFGSGESALQVLGLAPLGFLLLFLGGPLLLHQRFRDTLPCRGGRRIPSDVADQTWTLGGFDHGRMQLLRQLAGGKFGKGTGEFGFVRDCQPAAPAAELMEGLVDPQTVDELARGGQIQDGLATNAVARAARSLAGRPVAARPEDSTRPKGTKEITLASNSRCGPKRPTAASN